MSASTILSHRSSVSSQLSVEDCHVMSTASSTRILSLSFTCWSLLIAELRTFLHGTSSLEYYQRPTIMPYPNSPKYLYLPRSPLVFLFPCPLDETLFEPFPLDAMYVPNCKPPSPTPDNCCVFHDETAIMRIMIRSEPQLDRIKDRMFVRLDVGEQYLNRKLSLVVNPEILHILFTTSRTQPTEQKLTLLHELSDIYQRNPNSSVLLWRRDCEIASHGISILDDLLDFMFGMTVERRQVEQLLQYFEQFVQRYVLNCRNFKKLTGLLARDFYDGRFEPVRLSLALGLLKKCFESQLPQAGPSGYFLMYGEGSGVRLLKEKNLWGFSRGFSLHLSFVADGCDRFSQLMYIRVKECDFVLAINQQSRLVVKVFGETQQLDIDRVEIGQWYYLRMDYVLRSKLFSKSFSLKVWLNDKLYEQEQLPIPQIHQQDELSEMVFGRDFYGRINCIALSRETDNPELLGRNSQFWLNNWSEIESLLRCNRSLYENLYLLYVPFILTEVKDRTVVFDLSSRNHGDLLENSAIWCHSKRYVSDHGGMFNLLPLFYLMRFYSYDSYPQLLEELLEVVRVIFSAGYIDAEEEALNCMFFEVIGAHLSQVDSRWLTVKAVGLLYEIKERIGQAKVKEQFLKGLLWRLNLKHITNGEVVRMLMLLIRSMYAAQPKFCLSLWTLDHCLHYIQQNFEPMRLQGCCMQHEQQFLQQHKFQQEIKVSDHYDRIGPVSELTLFIARLHLQENIHQGLKMVEHILMFMICQHSNCYTRLLVKLMSGIYQLPIRHLQQRMVRGCNMLSYLYLLLNRSTTYDMLQSIVELLALIYNFDREQAPKILYMLAAHFKKINMSSNQASKMARSISDSCSSPSRLNKVVRRESLSLTTEQQTTIESIPVMAQRIRLRKKNLSNHRLLMTAVLSIAMKRMGELPRQDLPEEIHLNDEAMILLLQYHQQCCLLFRKEIVLMVWAAVMGASPQLKQQIRNSYYLTQYFLLRTLVNAYLDRQLQTECLHQLQHHILQVFKSLALTTINNPQEFCQLFLRIQSLLVTCRKDIESTIEQERRLEVMFVSRYVLRRWLIVLLTSKQFCTHAEPMMSMAFAVYSCVFCQEKEHETGVADGLLEYFSFVEKELFMVEGHCVPEHCLSEFPEGGAVLIDLRLIETYVAQLNLHIYKLPQNQNTYNKIAMYLDPNFAQEFSEVKTILFREVDFSNDKQPNRSEFLDFFESLFQRSMIDEQQPAEMKELVSQKKVLVVETMVLMLELALEYCLRKDKLAMFQSILLQMEQCLKITVLVCENSGSGKDAAREQKQIVRKLVLQVLHCLYNLMDNEKQHHYNDLMEAALGRIFYFLYANIDILNQKLGNVATFQDALHFGSIIKSVERYNLVLMELFDRHVRDQRKNQLISLSRIKEFRYMERQRLLEQILSDRYKAFFKKGKFVTKLLTAEIQRQIREVQRQFREMSSRESLQTKLKLTQQNFGYELSSQVGVISSEALTAFNRSQMAFLRQQNLQYRKSMYSWSKIWKRLRLFQYPWSVWMDQKEDRDWSWQAKNKKNPYIKRKFSKFQSDFGTRPFLTVSLEEPWHVKKANIQRQIEYMSKDYHYNFHRGGSEEEKQQHRNNWLRMFRREIPPESDEFRVEWIKNNTKRRGRLRLLESKLQFSYDSIYQKDSHLDFTHFRVGEFKPLQKVWPLTEIREVSRRRYLMKWECLLIELQNLTSLIFNFLDDKMAIFLQLLSRKQKSRTEDRHLLKLNNIRFYTEKYRYEIEDEEQWLHTVTEQWQHHQISNFQYLLFLNKAAGRSYYDPTQYPVCPWIISDYTCKQMVFRPLDKTMGALGSESRRQLIRQKSKNFDPFNPVPLYQYGTHYSSPGVIFNYLIRVQPYTEAARTLQGGRFDISDRIFYSLMWCWRSATTQMSDVRELCPEFYYMPEFLLNLEFYNFGLTQQKERVHNVQLPLWAEGDPYAYIALHRRAFESEEVSLMIHHWLDLIFGYKQKGKQAEQNLNLFYYLTYEDNVNLDEIEDEVSKTSAEAQIIHFGQTPCQLFEKPHPRRDERPRQPWLLEHPKCQLFSPKVKELSEWDDITLHSKPSQPILAVHLRGTQLQVMKCDSLMQFTVGSNQPILVSERRLNLKKTKNEIHLADLSFGGRVQFFGRKFIVAGFFLNGELRVYHTESGNMVESQLGSTLSCLYVNHAENLILTGARDHTFQVYELVYRDADHLELVSIATETLLDPISHISEGGGFYSVCTGHFVSVYSICRSAAFVEKKHKKVRCKFMRSYQAKNKVIAAKIYTSPLFGIAFHDTSTLWSYSANGQLLASRPMSIKLEPKIVRDVNRMDLLLCLQESQMTLLTTPNLTVLRSIMLPNNRIWTCWQWFQDTVVLGTNIGEIVIVTEDTTATSTPSTETGPTTITVAATHTSN